MPDEERGGVEQARLEDLRRRLYRPGASEEDRQRFTQLADLTDVDPPAVEPHRAPPRWTRRRVAVAGGAAALVLIAVAVAVRAEQTTPPPSATQAAIALSGSSDQLVRSALLTPSANAPTPSAIPSTLGGVPTRLQRFSGSGTVVVAIDTRSAQSRNGTLLVMLTSTSRAPLGWFATRAATGPDRSGFAEIVATGDPEVLAGQAPGYGMHVYDGPPPNRLVVQGADSTRWTLTIGFLPRKDLPY